MGHRLHRDLLVISFLPFILASNISPAPGDDALDLAVDTTITADTPTRVMAEMIQYQRPEYSRTSRTARHGGTVWLNVLVDADGTVAEVVVQQESGYKSLDGSASKAALECKYRPAKVNDTAVSMWVSYGVEFEVSRNSAGVSSRIPDIMAIPPGPVMTLSGATTVYKTSDGLPADSAGRVVRHERAVRYAPVGGQVWVESLVGQDSAIQKTEILASSGIPALDSAALIVKGFEECQPAQRDGQPVDTWIKYKIEFKPHSRLSTVKWFGNILRKRSLLTSKEEFPTLRPMFRLPDSLSFGSEPVNIDGPPTREFGILLFRATEPNLTTVQRAVALIDAGCADGLTEGLEGTIWEETTAGPVRVGRAVVRDVGANETMCIVEPSEDMVVSKFHEISFDGPGPTPEERLSLAIDYFDQQMPEHALACFESIAELADSNAMIAARLEQCRQLNAAKNENPGFDELESLRKQAPALLIVAESYFRLGNKAATEKALAKILKVDSTNAGALELQDAVTVLDSCLSELLQPPMAIIDATEFDRDPAFLFYELPNIPVSLIQFNDLWYTMHQYRKPTVGMQALISSTGRVLNASISESSGFDAIDLATLAASYHNKFEPAISCGKAVSTWIEWQVPIIARDNFTAYQGRSQDADSLPKINDFVQIEVIAEMTRYARPKYPHDAVQAGQGGLVWIKALVGSDGRVWNAVVYRSSGIPSLDHAALEVAYQNEFKPAIQNGRTVSMWVTYKVEFKLDGR
jgi:TonB family protein